MHGPAIRLNVGRCRPSLSRSSAKHLFVIRTRPALPDRIARASALYATGERSIELWGSVFMFGGIAEKSQVGGNTAEDREPSIVCATRFRFGRRTHFMLPCVKQRYPDATMYDSQASATAMQRSEDKKISRSEYV